MEEIVKIIRDAPAVCVATIRPTTSLQRPPVDPDAPPTRYAVLDYDKMAKNRGSTSSGKSSESVGYFDEPGLSSDENTEEGETVSVSASGADALSVEHVQIEGSHSSHKYSDKSSRSRSPHPPRSRSPQPPRARSSQPPRAQSPLSGRDSPSQLLPLAPGREASETGQQFNYAQLQWGVEDSSTPETAEEKSQSQK